MISLPTRRSDLHGFTLLEMLIVLAILSAMATMAWPALRKELDKRQLRSAAKQVQRELASARNRAVKTGQVLEFRYQLNRGQFRIDAITLPRMEGVADLTDATEGDRGPGRFDDPSDGSAQLEGRLPEGTFFLSVDPDRSDVGPLDEPVDRAVRGKAPGQEPAFAPSVDDFPAGPTQDPLRARDDRTWSPPILFFPNGQTSPARIRVGNQRGVTVAITLRALTGLGTLGEMRLPKVVR